MFFVLCQEHARARALYPAEPTAEAARPCGLRATTTRDGYRLCWTCAAAIDAIRAFAARVAKEGR